MQSLRLKLEPALIVLGSIRSSLGLVGKHIHINTGRWVETMSGIGSNYDSFYEYLLKSHLLFRRPNLKIMFSDVFQSVKKHVQV